MQHNLLCSPSAHTRLIRPSIFDVSSEKLRLPGYVRWTKSPEFQTTGRWLVNQIDSPLPSVPDYHTLRSTPSANHTVNNWTGRNVQTFHGKHPREILAMPWRHIPCKQQLTVYTATTAAFLDISRNFKHRFVNWQNEPWLLYHEEITGILICAMSTWKRMHTHLLFEKLSRLDCEDLTQWQTLSSSRVGLLPQ